MNVTKKDEVKKMAKKRTTGTNQGRLGVFLAIVSAIPAVLSIIKAIRESRESR